jgi:hypothetical protein
MKNLPFVEYINKLDELFYIEMSIPDRDWNEKITLDIKDIWIDEKLGLVLKDNVLFFFDSRDGNFYKTLITDRVIWLADDFLYTNSLSKDNFKNYNTQNNDLKFTYRSKLFKNEKMYSSVIPLSWVVPSLADWNQLSAFIAKKNGYSHPLMTQNSVNICGIECSQNDLLICIDRNSNLVKYCTKYILLGFDKNGINVFDVNLNKPLQLANSTSLTSIPKYSFKLLKNWEPGDYIPYHLDMDLSFINPKFKIANKFGINYLYSRYFTKALNNNAIVVSNNNMTCLSTVEDVSLRLFTPLSNEIIEKFKKNGFVPKFVNYEELKLKINFEVTQQTKIKKAEEKVNNYSTVAKSGDLISQEDYFIGEKIICKIKCEFNYGGNIKILNIGDILTVSSINTKKELLSVDEYPQLNRADPKTWLPFSFFNKIFPKKTGILDYFIGEKIICKIKCEFNYGGNIKILNIGDILTVSSINTKKELLSVDEYPQLNKTDPKTWFSIQLFN